MHNDYIIVIIDISISHNLYPINIESNIEILLESKEEMKKKKYLGRCKEYWFSFIPCIITTSLILKNKFNSLIKLTAKRLKQKWNKPYSKIKIISTSEYL